MPRRSSSPLPSYPAATVRPPSAVSRQSSGSSGPRSSAATVPTPSAYSHASSRSPATAASAAGPLRATPPRTPAPRPTASATPAAPATEPARNRRAPVAPAGRSRASSSRGADMAPPWHTSGHAGRGRRRARHIARGRALPPRQPVDDLRELAAGSGEERDLLADVPARLGGPQLAH